jgi:O-acetyl-ADP-ribose deacetylase (regulator of RNase III)
MSPIVVEHTLAEGVELRVVRADLTLEPVEAIVNAANAQLAHGGGLAAAIVRRGGADIQAESDAWARRHGPVSHDRPAVTGAGRLSCRYILHAVGPVWGSGDEDRKLAATTQAALRTAEELELKSLAMPAISTGIFGFPKDRAARVMLGAIEDYFRANPGGPLREVRVALIDDECIAAFESEFRRRWLPHAAGDSAD